MKIIAIANSIQTALGIYINIDLEVTA